MLGGKWDGNGGKDEAFRGMEGDGAERWEEGIRGCVVDLEESEH